MTKRLLRASTCITALLLMSLTLLLPAAVHAQDDAGPPPLPDTSKTAKMDKYDNLFQGQFTPGSGFDIIRSEIGSLNISFYGLFRYINQTPAVQTNIDHLGRARPIDTRNDLNWHRTMVWLTGWFYDPKFRYNITCWSLASTEQTLLFGNMRYLMSERMTFGVGVGPNLTSRSLQGSWPYWAASDRQMGEEFLRGGFSSAFWITGKARRGLYYTASVNRSISQLGNTTADDNRDMAYSASVWAHPTTGEFGPRGGFGDLEHHKHLATQFGMSAGTSREGRYAPIDQTSKATQIRLSDGVLPFETGALAESVTVNKLTYRAVSFDAGAKYRGFSFQGEYTYRELSHFDANGPLPLSTVIDHGFFAEAMHMVVPKKLGVYAVGSYVFDEFDRNPFEYGGGANFYPYGRRNWRLNLHVLHVDRSPTGSSFGYYVPGLTGTIFSLGTDVLL